MLCSLLLHQISFSKGLLGRRTSPRIRETQEGVATLLLATVQAPEICPAPGKPCLLKTPVTVSAFASPSLSPFSVSSSEMRTGLCRVRESLTGNDLAGSDGSGKGSGIAPQNGTGASAPERPGRREGSEEGCTSQEHPKPPSRAAAGSRLSNPTPKDFAAFAGPQGIVDAAQMAQAASALQQSVQQSGLGPYFMQQAYAPQLAQAQLQQVCVHSLYHSPYNLTNCLFIY